MLWVCAPRSTPPDLGCGTTHFHYLCIMLSFVKGHRLDTSNGSSRLYCFNRLVHLVVPPQSTWRRHVKHMEIRKALPRPLMICV
jgi:hypothetical protein